MPRFAARRAVGLVALLGAMVASTDATAQSDPDIHLSAMWGQTISSQLVGEDPISLWNVAISAPLITRIGLRTQLRFDSIVFGEPGNVLSLAVHPGRTDYNLAVSLIPPGRSVGLEAHHVSSHAVEPLHDGSDAAFESTVDVGGASNFVSILYRRRGVEARLGLGSVWADTNTAPVLLGVDGILLNSRIARGPFATASAPVRWGALHGRVGAVYIRDWTDQGGVEGDILAWGGSLSVPMAARLSLGVSYGGNNGVPQVKRADNIISAYFKLDWSRD